MSNSLVLVLRSYKKNLTEAVDQSINQNPAGSKMTWFYLAPQPLRAAREKEIDETKTYKPEVATEWETDDILHQTPSTYN